jgi:Protein of unknown function (DUF1493)
VDDSIEARVYRFLVEALSRPCEELRAKKTLSHDLGVEGHDALELFEKFGDEFRVDLSGLYEDGSQYFAAEGVSPAGVLVILGPGALLGFGMELLFARLPAWSCFSVGMLIWLVPFFYFVRRRSRRALQISIEDLIDCAKEGRWSKSPPTRLS